MVKKEDVQLWSCVLTAMEAKARKHLPRSSYLEVIGRVLVYSMVPEYADMDRLSLQDMDLKWIGRKRYLHLNYSADLNII